MSRIDISDNDLANFAAQPISIEPDTIELSHAVFQRLVAELRARRATDLTTEEREALEWVRNSVQYDWPDSKAVSKPKALAVLDKLLARKS